MSRMNELINYVNLLLKLHNNGIDCSVKIEEAINEIHVEMGFKSDMEKIIDKLNSLPPTPIHQLEDYPNNPFDYTKVTCANDKLEITFGADIKSDAKSIASEIAKNIKRNI